MNWGRPPAVTWIRRSPGMWASASGFFSLRLVFLELSAAKIAFHISHDESAQSSDWLEVYRQPQFIRYARGMPIGLLFTVSWWLVKLRYTSHYTHTW